MVFTRSRTLSWTRLDRFGRLHSACGPLVNDHYCTGKVTTIIDIKERGCLKKMIAMATTTDNKMKTNLWHLFEGDNIKFRFLCLYHSCVYQDMGEKMENLISFSFYLTRLWSNNKIFSLILLKLLFFLLIKTGKKCI